MKTTSLIFVVVISLISSIYADEICPIENCVTPCKCEEVVKDTKVACQQQGTTCCSVIKSEFRTHCRHHGGECMDKCAASLTRDTVDCSPDQVCCVLV